MAKMNASVGGQSTESNQNSNRFSTDYATTFAGLSNSSLPPLSNYTYLEGRLPRQPLQGGFGRGQFEPRQAEASVATTSGFNLLPNVSWTQFGPRNAQQQQLPHWQWQPAQADLPQEEPEQSDDEAETSQPAGEETAPPGQEEEGGGAEEEEPPNNNNNELEEESGRRSFSEEQSDTNERDRDGEIVVSKRRHLINGKPVKLAKAVQRRLSPAAADEATANKSSEQLDEDFDKLVREIDAERREDKQEAPLKQASRRQLKKPVGQRRLDAAPQVEASSNNATKLPSLVSSASERDSVAKRKATKRADSAKGAKKKKPPSSHEHRLEESLSAQQWDDDQATAGAPRGDENVADIVDSDEEAKNLKSMATRVLQTDDDEEDEEDADSGVDESDEQPEEDSRSERKRRRRSIATPVAQPDSSAAANSSQLAHLGNSTSVPTGGDNSTRVNAAELVGAADMKVDIIAQYPPYGNSYPSAGGQAPAANFTPPGEIVWAAPRLASESGHVKKKVKKKKSASRTKKKSSKLANSKYKAAEAHKKSRASKQNKGKY